MQKQDKQGKDVMWCFVEFDEVVQAARCMKVLQVRAPPHQSPLLHVIYSWHPMSTACCQHTN